MAPNIPDPESAPPSRAAAAVAAAFVDASTGEF
jgi:hypothetical protein